MGGQLSEAIFEAASKPKLLPALILLYTAIDIISSLTRPKAQESTSGPIFKKWVSDYMLSNSGLPVTAQDIWAARCGLLHTSTVESDLSRGGNARHIHYVFDSKELADSLQKKTDPAMSKNIVVSIPHLLAGYAQGILRFNAEIGSDPELRELVYYHSDKLVVQDSLPLN